MRILAAVLMLASFSAAYAADENGSGDEVYSSTQAYSEEGEEAGQVMVQDSEEDVLNFVEDYIKKDIALKGSFLMEDAASKQLLKLKFLQLRKEVVQEETAKIAVAELKDSNSRQYEAHFYVTGMNWGNLDISKIVLKKTAPAKEPAKKTEPQKPAVKEDKKSGKR